MIFSSPASFVGVLGGVTSPLGRAILSKSVHPDDVGKEICREPFFCFPTSFSYIAGKVFSLTSSLEALTPVAATPLYTYIYKATYLTVPGTFYMLSSGLYVVNFGLLMYVCYLIILFSFIFCNYIFQNGCGNLLQVSCQ